LFSHPPKEGGPSNVSSRNALALAVVARPPSKVIIVRRPTLLLVTINVVIFFIFCPFSFRGMLNAPLVFPLVDAASTSAGSYGRHLVLLAGVAEVQTPVLSITEKNSS
jgi:hypothetical protein